MEMFSCIMREKSMQSSYRFVVLARRKMALPWEFGRQTCQVSVESGECTGCKISDFSETGF